MSDFARLCNQANCIKSSFNFLLQESKTKWIFLWDNLVLNESIIMMIASNVNSLWVKNLRYHSFFTIFGGLVILSIGIVNKLSFLKNFFPLFLCMVTFWSSAFVYLNTKKVTISCSPSFRYRPTWVIFKAIDLSVSYISNKVRSCLINIFAIYTKLAYIISFCALSYWNTGFRFFYSN